VSAKLKAPRSESDAPSTASQYDPLAVKVARSTLHGSKPAVSLARSTLPEAVGQPSHS